MSSQVPSPPRKLPLVKLAIAAVALGVLALFALRGVDFQGWIEDGMALIRRAGPWAFFSAMAVLPAIGAPLAAFTIPAGEAFADQMGLGGVIAVALTVLVFNLALAYGVARYVFRPVLVNLIKRYGYEIPRVTPENALSVALLVRLTPGPPYAVQNFILGVAEVPFRIFMIVSWLAVAPWEVGGIVLGKGLFEGNFKIVAIGMGVLVVAVVIVQWLRKKYSRRES